MVLFSTHRLLGLRAGGSLTGLALAVLVAMAALAASAAQALPPSPVLTGTNPQSPGSSNMPRILGKSNGIGISVVSDMVGGESPVAMATNPESTIAIYTTFDCSGAVKAVGSVAELESEGIQVTVLEGSTTTFYAAQTDASGTSPCSDGLTYRQVSDPPNAPAFTAVNPPSPADDNNPRLIGEAEDESTVSIFTNAECAEAPIASGSAAMFAANGIQVSVADNSTTAFYASASWAGLSSVCSSSSIAYEESSPPPVEGPPPPSGQPPVSPAESPPAPPGEGALPAPHLRMLPASRANDNTPLVAGSAAGAAFVRIYDSAGCAGASLVKGSPAQLAVGLPVQVADNTTTDFYGVAFDAAGKSSSCSSVPAVYSEDSIPPLTRITLGPGVKTRARAPIFRFTDATEEPGTSFFCRLDRGGWKACQTPWHMPRLGRVAHIVRVKAVDAAGNSETAGAKRRFKVVARPRRY